MEVDAALCRAEWLHAMRKFGTRIKGMKPEGKSYTQGRKDTNTQSCRICNYNANGRRTRGVL